MLKGEKSPSPSSRPSLCTFRRLLLSPREASSLCLRHWFLASQPALTAEIKSGSSLGVPFSTSTVQSVAATMGKISRAGLGLPCRSKAGK